jgi:hypothetical protein
MNTFWPHRLRWRMRSAAWMWPTYAAAVVADAAILHFLPPVGSEQQIPAPAGLNLVGDVILAAAVNLFLIAVVAPWLGRRLHERRAREAEQAQAGPMPPYEVVLGRTAAVLMATAALGLVIVGFGNRPLIVSETNATEAAARTLRSWVHMHGTQEMQDKVDAGIANSARLAPNFFRLCIPTNDLHRANCFFVDTSVDPPTIRRDPDMRNNADQVHE